MWGVYGDPRSSPELQAFMEGLDRLALPYRERHHNGFAPRGQTEDFRPVVVSGLRAEGAMIRDAYNALGVPCIVIDYGYLSRVSGRASFQTGYWQVGLNRLGWIPPFPCPGDRLERLGVKIKSRGLRGERIYVCGQHAGDPSHGLERDGIVKWALGAFESLRLVTDRDIVWRPHPDSRVHIGGLETSEGPIDWDDVFCVVTINSNIGHEAIIEGVPVVSATNAPYAELSEQTFSEDVSVASTKSRTNYFQRLSYAQWTLEEIRAGEPVLWLKEKDLVQ